MSKMTVKYKDIRKIIDKVKECSTKTNPDISFEYIVGSCFPNALENIKAEMRKQYTKGYIDGEKGGNETQDMELLHNSNFN